MKFGARFVANRLFFLSSGGFCHEKTPNVQISPVIRTPSKNASLCWLKLRTTPTCGSSCCFLSPVSGSRNFCGLIDKISFKHSDDTFIFCKGTNASAVFCLRCFTASPWDTEGFDRGYFQLNHKRDYLYMYCF